MKIILKGNPKSNNTIYRNHGHIRYMTKEGKEIKESYQWQAKTQFSGEPLKGDLEIEVKLFFGSKRKKLDIDNFGKLLLDSCNKIIWEDDSQIVKQTVEKKYSRENPRIELEIKKIAQ